MRKGPKPTFESVTQRAYFNVQSGRKCIGMYESALDIWLRAATDASRNSKDKGDLFEELCRRILLSGHLSGPYGCIDDAWLLQDVPQTVCEHLNLRRKDYGIDIIACSGDSTRPESAKFYAIQAKFRTRRRPRGKAAIINRGKILVNYRELATFEAAVAATGPYAGSCLMTSADGGRRGAKRDGNKSNKRTFAYGTLVKLPQQFWLDVSLMNGQRLVEETPEQKISIEDVRAARLARFS